MSLRKHVPVWARCITLIGLVFSVTLLVAAWYAPTSYSTELPTNVAFLQARLEQASDDQETLSLALEFGFDPMIVQVVRHLASDAMILRDETDMTWRFIDSEWELTYLLLSIIQGESRGQVDARGDSGKAFGLGQMHLATAKKYRPDVTGDQLLRLQDHLEIAVAHFVDLLQIYDGNYTLAVLAWNRGQASVNRAIALGQSPANGYARKVYLQAAVRNARGTQ